MLRFIALPLLIVVASLLLGLAFALMRRRAARRSPPRAPDPSRIKLNGDAAKLQQLIGDERLLNPSSSETELELRAYRRLRDKN